MAQLTKTAAFEHLDWILPIPVGTIFHVWEEDYSRMPVPGLTKEPDDRKLGHGFFFKAERKNNTVGSDT